MCVPAMSVLKNSFYILVTGLLLTLCFFSPTATTKVSFIALLCASLALMYLSEAERAITSEDNPG